VGPVAAAGHGDRAGVHPGPPAWPKRRVAGPAAPGGWRWAWGRPRT
jgi:hypothetical protein